MIELPSGSNAVQYSENVCNSLVLNYESPALTAELQARLCLPKLDRRCVPNSAVIRRNCRVGGDLGEGH
jgi:hypothetical protein